MNNRDHASLTPDERELAQRLSRLGGQAGPSPALDAKILSAARAATQAPRRQQRSRWPIGLGVAASLALAIGVAWQLRPIPEEHILEAADEATSYSRMAQPAPAVAEQDAASAASQSAPAPDNAPLAPPAQEVPPQGRMQAVESAPAVAADEPAAAAAATQSMRAEAPSPAVLFDDPGPIDVPPPPPAPPAPPAPRAAPATPVFAPAPPSAQPDIPGLERERLEAAKQLHTARQMQAKEQAAEAGAHQAREQESLNAIMVTGARARRSEAASQGAADRDADQLLDDRPPVSFSSPAARDVWLERIRELVRTGDIVAARESLREFRRRHPDHVLPKDLKALLDE